MTTKLHLSDLPEETQLELYEQLHQKFGRRRTSQAVTKEQRLKAVADIFQALMGFKAPQQRSILIFAILVLENAGRKWWRDASESTNKDPNKKGRTGHAAEHP